MGMFNFQSSPNEIILSRYFWLYWAIAIPLTLFVMAVWLLWYRWQEKREKKRMHDEERLDDNNPPENTADDSSILSEGRGSGGSIGPDGG